MIEYGGFRYIVTMSYLLCLSSVCDGGLIPRIDDIEVRFQHSKSEKHERWRRQTEIQIEQVIKDVIEYYKKPNPKGFPGRYIDDPLRIPGEINESLMAMADIKMYNMSVTGLNNFDLKSVKVDLLAQEFSYEIFFSSLTAYGQYHLTYIWSQSSSQFNISLLDVKIIGKGVLDTRANGTFHLSDIHTDMKFSDVKFEVEDAGTLGWVVDKAINIMGSFLIESIKPHTLDKANQLLMETVNTQLMQVNQEPVMSESVPIIDSVIFKARQWLRENNYDPLPLHNIKAPDILTAQLALTDGILTGLSSIHRHGELSLKMQNYTLMTTTILATQRISGSYHWNAKMFGYLERDGLIRFSVNNLKIRMQISQPMNLDKKPNLDALHIELGEMKLRSEGAGSLDYVIEGAVNSLSNIFKKDISHAIQQPIMLAAEEQLNKVDFEELILNNM